MIACANYFSPKLLPYSLGFFSTQAFTYKIYKPVTMTPLKKEVTQIA